MSHIEANDKLPHTHAVLNAGFNYSGMSLAQTNSYDESNQKSVVKLVLKRL
jgi:hypothetical protein